MALTSFQSELLRLLAKNRIENPESYVNFHDSREGMMRSWDADWATLKAAGCKVKSMRELNFFMEAEVERDGQRMEIQWGTDSAYRLFPLQPDPVVGFTLHPLDLVANKLSALVGRAEVRDWIDTITAVRELQPLACLLSAACGKDPGYSPTSMLEYVARRHYNQVEIDEKIVPKGVYDAAELCRFWHETVERTWETLKVFPRNQVGKAVMTKSGELWRGDDAALRAALAADELTFHEGTIGGVWPRIIDSGM